MSNEPWYVKSFQEDYLRIYAHRTDEAASQEVEHIHQLLHFQPNQEVLDLCCGNGRHSRQLADLGLSVTGIDLSSVLLREAEERSKGKPIEYHQYDVREIPFEGRFDFVLNLFTSFGYFDEPEENLRVFKAIARALKPTGVFLIDFLNPSYVEANLVPHSVREADGLVIREARKIENRQVKKRIEVEELGQVRSYEESVNLFTLEEMKVMLLKAGLQVEQVWGDFDQTPYDPVQTPRMILIGRK